MVCTKILRKSHGQTPEKGHTGTREQTGREESMSKQSAEKGAGKRREDTQVAARGLLKERWGWLAGTFKDALLRAVIIKAPEKSPSQGTQESHCSTYTLRGASEFKNPVSKDLKGPF